MQIRNGKGGRDRFAMLSQRALEAIREYWLMEKPKDDLFISKRNEKVSIRAVQNASNGTKRHVGIEKRATLHTLRLCFSTHLLENDVNLFNIKKVLEHASIRSSFLPLLKKFYSFVYTPHQSYFIFLFGLNLSSKINSTSCISRSCCK